MNDNHQLCNYALEIEGDEMNAVELNHQETYGRILDLCRSKASAKPNENLVRYTRALENT